MKDYERMRASISKHFKNEIEKLKFEIIRLNKENADLQAENFALKKDIQKYKTYIENKISAYNLRVVLNVIIKGINSKVNNNIFIYLFIKTFLKKKLTFVSF